MEIRPQILFLVGMLIAELGVGQSIVRIQEKLASDQKSCFNLQLSISEQNLRLASQNYRLFYDSGNLTFDEGSARSFLPEENYQMRVVQHKMNIDAHGLGNLHFDKNLGFINTSIVYNNVPESGFALEEELDWVDIAQFCFNVKDPAIQRSVVLARENLTSEYGRAYVEVSSYNEENELITIPFSQYIDPFPIEH